MSNDKLTDEDKALFQNMMSSVKPLKQTQTLAPRAKPPDKIPSRKIQHAPPPQINYQLSNYYAEPVSSEAILSYGKHNIPRKRMSELKSGKIPWEARLDLHGLRPDGACDALCQFIDSQAHNNKRCLLIIHGKGGQNFNAPILKNLVNLWLSQLPQVLAFHSALPRDGGSGALYVLLRRT